MLFVTVQVWYERYRHSVVTPVSPALDLGSVVVCDITGRIDDETVAKLYRLDRAIRRDTVEAPILLRISSTGGDTDAALMGYSLLQALPNRILTYGIGVVQSSAIVLFAAGAQRHATPLTRFTIHDILTTGTSLKLADIEEMAENVRHRTDGIVRSIANATHRPFGAVARDVEYAKVMSAQQARRYGLVTSVSAVPRFSPLLIVE